MEELIKYLKENKISYSELTDEVIEINGGNYMLVKPDDEGLLFSDKFMLMAEQECDFYVYNFGGNWYWEKKADIEKPKLNDLRYLGKSTSEFSTKTFLGVHGGYEILNGSSLYDSWVKKAKFLGVENLGICEKNTLAGVLKFQIECQKYKIKPIIGATYTVLRESEDFRYDIKLFVKNEQGWENLLLINKEVNVTNNKFVTEKRLGELLDGLVVILDPKTFDKKRLNSLLTGSVDYFQLDTVQFENEEHDKWYLENLKTFFKSYIPPISMTDAYYLEPEHSHIKKTLNAISGVREPESNNQYFKDKEDYFNELELLFDPNDERYFNTSSAVLHSESKLAQECNFSIKLGQRFLPKYEMRDSEKAKFETNEDLFWYLVETGLQNKILNKDKSIYLKRIETEFNVIEKGVVLDYFLILWDIISYARENGVLVGIGRGSAGGSLISYLLDIIQLDPLEFDLLFERFLNEGRIVKSLPDIDTDFPGAKRGLIKLYVEGRYGSTQVCSVGTYTALQIKASIKDLAKQYDVNFGDVNQVTTMLPNMKDFIELFYAAAGSGRIKAFIKSNPDVINDVKLILHQPKAKSIHACAMLILPKDKDMYRWLPICNIDGQLVSEWEGPELEAAGFLKEDILGVLQLDKFENILKLIKENTGKEIDIYSITFENRKVYEYFSKGWNEDVFHFGSPGLTGYCKELKPENIEDLIAGISLYRPGAMENNFHNEYILRKEGKRETEYFIGSEEILKNTFGVFVYQEQIMKLCQVLGGLSLVEADDVRKAMVKKKYEELTKYQPRFLEYYRKEFGVTKEYADKVWDSIDKASTYLFNRSHATAYAITGFISQWLKVNYPVEFWSTAFQFAEEKDYANFLAEIKVSGDIKVFPVEINKSRDNVYTDFKTKSIYWPLSSIKQCGEKAASQIIELRDKNGQFFSFEEFLTRNKFTGSKVNKAVVENLIMSGAFDQIEHIDYPSARIRLFEEYRKFSKAKIDPEKDILKVNAAKIENDWWWSLQQKQLSGIAFFDYENLTFDWLNGDEATIKPEDFQLESNSRNKRKVKIGGYLTDFSVRESKKGDWAKLTLESNYNFINVLIWSEQFKAFKGIDFKSKLKTLVLISGQISWDSYGNRNILQTNEDTEFIILE